MYNVRPSFPTPKKMKKGNAVTHTKFFDKILIKLHALSYSGFSSKIIFVLLKKLKKPFRGLVNLANEF